MTIKKAVHMAKHENYRMATVEATPDPLFIKIYETLTDNRIEPYGSYHRLTTGYDRWAIPRPKDALRLTHIGDSPQNRVFNKYTHGTKVRPKQGDYVVDVGAFIGEYSMQCWTFTNDVTAIEPDPGSFKCLEVNLPDHYDLHNVAVNNEERYEEFHAGVDHAESGLLEPDDGEERATFEVKTKRLDSILDRTPDMLKVEAEGCEPEVLDSLGSIRPRKLAINVSPERDGESPIGPCLQWLLDNGYEYHDGGRVLFGWMD